MIASPYRTLLVTGIEDTISQIKEVIDNEKVAEIVVGVPQRPGEVESQQAKAVKEFIEKLRSAINLPIHTTDESYSSVEAEEALHQMGRKVGQDKGAVDRIAASLILKQYLMETST